MSVSADRLDLKKIPFARSYNRFMVVEAFPEEGDDPAFPKLYLSISQNFITPTRWNLVRFAPTFGGEEIPFTYIATPSVLRLVTDKGEVRVDMDANDIIRLESEDGLGLLFSMTFEMHEKCLDRGDGTIDMGINVTGEFLFEATTGRQTLNAVWNYRWMKPLEPSITWEPEGKNVAGYVLFNEQIVIRPALPLRPLDELIAANKKSFEDWAAKYPKLPEKYAEVRNYAVYNIWSSYMAPKGMLMHPTVYMMRSGLLTRAMTWQQSYQAMAAWRNPELCLSLLYSMFTLQDEYGMLPDGASDKEVIYTATKPPFQGFALSWILSHQDIECIDRELIEKLYGPFVKWVRWWLTFRDLDQDGLVGYAHGDESGFDDSSIFAGGVPVETPDAAAFIILCLEALGKLAGRLGLTEESADWQKQSDEMLKKMLDTMWNGEKFICLREKTHEVVDQESISVYQPIILGRRLPQEVIDKLTAAIMDPERFFTPHGIASESRKSPYYDGGMGGFVLGMPIAPVQLMITLGLYTAGKTAEAKKIAEVWLGMGNEGPEGPLTVWRPPVPVPVSDDPDEKPVFTGVRYPGGCCTWGSAVFLILGDMLSEIEKED